MQKESIHLDLWLKSYCSLNFFGTHLNLEGTLNISNSSIDNVKLILKSKDNEDISIPTKYTIEGSTLEFTTGEKV